MTKSSPSDTKQQPEQHDPVVPGGQSSDHGRTGEGAASALAHLISQDQKHRNQSNHPEEPSAGSGHP
jgi:hypothetical protein